MTCPRCAKPEPRDWCWEGNPNCEFPPRHLTVQELWTRYRELDERLKKLEPHFEVPKANWETKVRCFCGEDFATRRELSVHLGRYSDD